MFTVGLTETGKTVGASLEKILEEGLGIPDKNLARNAFSAAWGAVVVWTISLIIEVAGYFTYKKGGKYAEDF